MAQKSSGTYQCLTENKLENNNINLSHSDAKVHVPLLCYTVSFDVRKGVEICYLHIFPKL